MASGHLRAEPIPITRIYWWHALRIRNHLTPAFNIQRRTSGNDSKHAFTIQWMRIVSILCATHNLQNDFPFMRTHPTTKFPFASYSTFPSEFQDIPIVVAGNKLDLATTHREVRIEDVSEWVFCELPKLRWVFLPPMFGYSVISYRHHKEQGSVIPGTLVPTHYTYHPESTYTYNT